MTDILPKIKVNYCRKTEVERLGYTLKSLLSGFYTKNRFLCLPECPQPADPTIIVLPHLAYHTIPTLGRDLEPLSGRQIPFTLPDSLYTSLDQLLPPLTPLDTTPLLSSWNKIAPQFWQLVNRLWPKSLDLIASIEVRPTSIGTLSSWSLLTTASQNHVCYLRQDANIVHLAESILTALVRFYQPKAASSWEDSETFIDYLLSATEFNNLFSNYKPTIVSLRHLHPNQAKRSHAYLHQLQLPAHQPALSYQGRHIYYQQVQINNRLTKTEHRLLLNFLKHRNTLVEYDQLIDETWGEDSLINLWAATKAVQRLRSKLVKLGLPDTCITTVRSQGFILTL